MFTFDILDAYNQQSNLNLNVLFATVFYMLFAPYLCRKEGIKDVKIKKLHCSTKIFSNSPVPLDRTTTTELNL